jgi:hypothetical protein
MSRGSKARAATNARVAADEPVSENAFADEVDRSSLGDLLTGLHSQEKDRLYLYEFIAGQCGEFRTADVLERCRKGRRHAAESLRVLEDLQEELTGRKEHDGPISKLDVFRNTKMLELISLSGSVPPSLFELAALECVVAAEQKAESNRHFLAYLGEDVLDPPVRTALLKASQRLGELDWDQQRWAAESFAAAASRRVWRC